jgi:L,D-transpeptidase catalytic domain
MIPTYLFLVCATAHESHHRHAIAVLSLSQACVVLNLIPWLELKVAWYREALDAPILSRLSRDMPKMLLRIAIVLGLLFSTAKAKVMIQVDLDTQQMIVIKNKGETPVWRVSSGRSGFETPTGLFNVQRLDANHFSDEYDQSPMP